MPEPMINAMALAAEINRIASAAGGSPRGWMGLWQPLREILPFSAGWLGVRDPGGRRFLTAAAVGAHPCGQQHAESPAYYAEVESSGVFRSSRRQSPGNDARAPTRPWDRLWWPAGHHDGLGVPLIAQDGRPVGLLVLVTDTPGRPSDTFRQVIGEVAPMIATTIDPMNSVIGLAELVIDARASVAIDSGGAVHSLPGSPPHPLLSTGSAVLGIAADRLRVHHSPTAFLTPHPAHDPDGYLRVTAILCPRAPSSHFARLVIVSPPGDLHGLTRRELEVLGFVIDGFTNRQIASALHIAQRTVAAHLEHILSKLDVPGRTAAAVRSLELSLYVPPQVTSRDS